MPAVSYKKKKEIFFFGILTSHWRKESDPETDPLVRGDPDRTKMSGIPNTEKNVYKNFKAGKNQLYFCRNERELWFCIPGTALSRLEIFKRSNHPRQLLNLNHCWDRIFFGLEKLLARLYKNIHQRFPQYWWKIHWKRVVTLPEILQKGKIITCYR